MQRSDLYIFASNNEPGFSLNRRFTGAMPGVLGADLAASDLSRFLSKQRVTPTSVSFIFTRSGEIVAFPDKARVAALVPRNGEMMGAATQINRTERTRRRRVVRGLPGERRFRNPCLHRRRPDLNRPDRRDCRPIRARPAVGIAVPIDEIERPIIELRNRTLFYSIGFVFFELPLLCDADRRLDRSKAWAWPSAVTRDRG